MNIPTFIVLALIIAVVGLIVFRSYSNKKKGRSSCSCGCSCSSCTNSCALCNSAELPKDK